jgi:LacI family transcriptional regulator, galactose operon repressor
VRRLTIRDVAERAGVSLGTVSNVLNKPELVAADTRERVLAAISSIGFVRNDAARQLRAGRGQAIGLVTLDIGNPFFTEVARGVEDAADEAGLLVILCGSAGSGAREERQLRLLEEQRVAGILMSPVERTPSKRIREIHARGTPVVLLDRHRSARQWCSAAVNDTSGARLVAQHLLELGHKRIALVNGPIQLKPCEERRSSFVAVLAEHGIELEPSWDVEMPEMTIEAGEEAVAKLLGARKLPTAVFCTNDLLALGAERAALAKGLRVPDELGIVGYDDIRFARTSLIPLTTVRNPSYELGYESTKLLIDEATHGTDHVHRQLLFEPELVVRASTAALGRRSANGRATRRKTTPAAVSRKKVEGQR